MSERVADPNDPDTPPFRDAESWLAERGIEREPIRVRANVGDGAHGQEAAPPPPSAPPVDAAPADGRAPVQATEAVRLATEAPPPPPPGASAVGGPPEEPGGQGEPGGRLEDEVRKAVATCQRITSQAPQPEARLRRKLAARDVPRSVIDLALKRCRELGVVDDPAMAAALIEEQRAKGHAPARIRKDLTRRGFSQEVLDQALAGAEREDPEAAAFAVARQRAARLRGVEPETAVRRLVGFLARRGYPEGLCRKVARDVVYADREEQWIAQR